jgi:glyoxylase-like metal-dependent hydrolase (beta-lactamase superfamily II)
MNSNPIATEQALNDAIWRIDTAYVRPGLAACYLVQGGEEFALIECGAGLSVEPILNSLERLGVARSAVRYIIPTHVHLDHAGGAGGLMQALPQAQLYVHPRGARHLIDPTKLVAGATAVYGEAGFKASNGEILACPAERVYEAPDGTRLDLGGRSLVLRDAPGHARHHLVVWDERSQGFFTGDVFGLCYPELNVGDQAFIAPTTTPVQFDPEAWQATLNMLRGYAPRRMYLTHYGQVEDVARLSQELEQRVLEHAALGKAHREGSEAQLALILGDALYGQYEAAGGALTRMQFGDILKMDLALNAQGLL